jgi:hypothetical protein
VLSGIDPDAVPTCDNDRKLIIIRLAMILARARTFVERDHDHTVEYQPEAEGPSRIVQQLLKLAQGLALINGRVAIDDHDVEVLGRVTYDSMPPKRRKILEMFERAKSATGKQLEEALGLGQSATQEAMSDLIMLGICKTEGRSPAKPPSGIAACAAADPARISYTLSEDFRRVMDGIPTWALAARRGCETLRAGE